MKMKYARVHSTNEHFQCAVTKVIPAWEVPILQSVHPTTEIIKDEVYDVTPPSVSDEYDRLATCYGAEREEGGTVGDPYIEGVYGKGPAGLAALKIAMQGSVMPKSTPISERDPSPDMRKDLLQALEGADDLVGDLVEIDDPEEVEAV
jgi:hypothetical protein